MAGFKSLYWPVLVIVALCWIGSPSSISSQETSMMANTTNACIANTYKIFSPNMANPTNYVGIIRYLDMGRNCNLVAPPNFANCNPGSTMVVTGSLTARASGTQVTMSPGCSWTCTGCGAISTTGPQDGLPVELMNFEIE